MNPPRDFTNWPALTNDRQKLAKAAVNMADDLDAKGDRGFHPRGSISA